MTRNWKFLGSTAVLAAALAAAPMARAADPEKTAESKPATAKDLEEIKKILQKMGAAIAGDMEGIRTDFNLHVKKTQGDIEALKAQVEQLKKDIDALRKAAPSVSNYGPRSSTSLRPGTSGRIRLVNDFPYTTEVIVNGAPYFVEPGMVRELTLPAGTFSYRVPSAGITVQDRALAANQAITITIYAR